MAQPATMRQRRDTAARWTALDPVLPAGVLGFETDTRTFKLGDGTTRWSALAYFGGGGVSDGDKGDITVSGGGATWTIDNDAVTFAKMQNLSASRLIGRRSGSSGDPEEVQVGAGLSISAGAQLAAAVTGISINAASASDIDLSDSSPAAAAGSKNVTWATTGVGPTSVSGSVIQGPTLFKVLSAAANLTDGTSSQAWFPTNGAVTIAVNKAYFVEGTLRLSKSTGTASQVDVGFAGTAAYTMTWEYISQPAAFDAPNNTQTSAGVTTAASLQVVASGTQGNVWCRVFGVVRCTGAGTFIPQLKFSATTGTTPQALTGTRFMLTEIGADTVTERGTWS